jgi:hypothetical protein
MKYLLLLPLIVQAIVIFVDEFYFHFAPGQPRWERIGHSLDTVTVLAPVLWLLVSAPSERNLIVFSCCRSLCSGRALEPRRALYHASAEPITWLGEFHGLEFALPAQAAALALYMISQAVYWNLIWKAPAAQFGARQ